MKHIKYGIACLAVWLMLLIQTGIVMAAEGTVTYGSSSYSSSEGQEFQVGVYVKGSEAIGAYEFYLDYSADMLEYVSGADSGGGGRLKFTGYGNASSYNYMLTFRAKKAGSSNITISNVYLGPLNPGSGDSMTITAAASAPVSIQGPSTASDECRLAELNISPTGLWGFSPDKTEYDITVDNDISKLAITAKAESSKASVVISDTNLKEGVNTITIKVTAENGTVKNYSIIVRRKPAPTETQPVTTVTIPDIENLPLSFLVNGKDMYITEKVDGISAPDGFQKTTVVYEGQEIPAFTSLTQNITLFYLRDGLGENGAFYAYNSEKDMVYPFIRLTNAGSYMIVSPEADVAAPAGYMETTLSLSSGGDENMATAIQAWIQGDSTEFFLIYALNGEGECAFYQYDSKERTLQRYHNTGLAQPPLPEDETTPPADDTDKIAELENTIIRNRLNYQIETKNRLLIIIILAIFCVILIIAVIGLIFKLKGQADDGTDSDIEPDTDLDIDSNIELNKEPVIKPTIASHADSDRKEEDDLDLEEDEISEKKRLKKERRKARKKKQKKEPEPELDEISYEEDYTAEGAKELLKEAAATKEPEKKKEPKRTKAEEPIKKIENDLDDEDFLLDLDDDDFTFFDYDDEK